MRDFKQITDFIKQTFSQDGFIPLHEPRFSGNEKKYLNDCIDSTFVSSVGAYVDRFEKNFAAYVGSEYAVAVVNGTAALHVALRLVGVERGDEVITQPLTFVATANAVAYCGAEPVFIDVDIDTLGMSAKALKSFLENNCKPENGLCVNKKSGRAVKACLPMHTFGHPCRIGEIKELCDEWNLTLVEDAAESLGSRYKDRHTGTFGALGIFSFNGNKIVTSGGGGVIVTDDASLAKRAKHLTTTAKVPHRWEYVHDEVGFNYRMPNINAALMCAQLEQLDGFLVSKRELAKLYADFFSSLDIKFISEPKDSTSNYWLNTIILANLKEREQFLEYSNLNGVMTRPIWRLMNRLKAYSGCMTDRLENAEYLEARVVNIPSSVRIK